MFRSAPTLDTNVNLTTCGTLGRAGMDDSFTWRMSKHNTGTTLTTALDRAGRMCAHAGPPPAPPRSSSTNRGQQRAPRQERGALRSTGLIANLARGGLHLPGDGPPR